MTSEIEIIEAGGVVVAIIGLIIEHFHYHSNTNERLAKIETKVELFWNSLTQQLAPMLLHGNPIPKGSVFASLLEKYQCGCQLEKHDKERLITLLDESIVDTSYDSGERLIMAMLSATLKSQE